MRSEPRTAWRATPVSVGERLAAIAVLGLAAAIAVPLAVLEPGTQLLPACPSRSLFGLECPFCGSTRGVAWLLRGQLEAAVAANPLLVLILPLAGYLLLGQLLVAALARRLPPIRVRSWMVWALVVGLVAFTVARNLAAFECF